MEHNCAGLVVSEFTPPLPLDMQVNALQYLLHVRLGSPGWKSELSRVGLSAQSWSLQGKWSRPSATTGKKKVKMTSL